MIVHPDLRVEGFTQDSWRALLDLIVCFFEPGAGQHSATTLTPAGILRERWNMRHASDSVPPPTNGTPEGGADGDDAPLREGTLVLISSPSQQRTWTWHSLHGPCAPLPFPLQATLGELCEAHGVRRGVHLDERAWCTLLTRASARFHRDSDFVFQGLTLFRTLLDLHQADLLTLWPDASGWRRLPPPATLTSLAQRALPQTCALIAASWHRGSLQSALVARRQRGSFDLLAGPEQLLQWTGPMGGDWRRDFRVIVDAVEEHVAPVHVGIFGKQRHFEELLRTRQIGGFSRSIAMREIIVHPIPVTLGMIAGLDAAAAMTQSGIKRLQESEFLDRIAPVGAAVKHKALGWMSTFAPRKHVKLLARREGARR